MFVIRPPADLPASASLPRPGRWGGCGDRERPDYCLSPEYDKRPPPTKEKGRQSSIQPAVRLR